MELEGFPGQCVLVVKVVVVVVVANGSGVCVCVCVEGSIVKGRGRYHMHIILHAQQRT